MLVCQEGTMKKLLLPLAVFCLGLAIADYFFGVDIPGLFAGFGEFLKNLFWPSGR
jgi:hypothetical protein